ncbi:MAG: hypothetical protein P8P36_02155, partial [Akkermansiaceae bacterium]|nr:hypothetical protein [Akkermansiaceae bacterium]
KQSIFGLSPSGWNLESGAVEHWLHGHFNFNCSSLYLRKLKLLGNDPAHLGREFLAAGRLEMHVTTFFAKF